LLGASFALWQAALALSAASCLAWLGVCLRNRRPGPGGEASLAAQPGLERGRPKRRARRSSELRRLLHVVVLASLAYMLWLQPVRGPVVEMHFAVAAGAYALWALLAARARGRAARLEAGLDLACSLLLVLLAGAQLVVHLWAAWRPSPLFDLPESSGAQHLLRNALQPGAVINGFPVNSTGDYDTEFDPADGALVVSLGDSFSVGIVPQPFHFTAVAEELLPGVQICNVGVPSIGPREYLILLRERALPMRPRAVLLNLFVGNDINQADKGPEWHGGTWSWLDPSRWLLGLVVERLVMLSDEQFVAPLVLTSDEPGDGSTGWRRGDPRIEALRATAVQSLPWLEDPDLEPPAMEIGRYRSLEVARAGWVCGPATRAYERLFALIDEMRSLCAGTPLLVQIIPDEFQVEDGLWQEIIAVTSEKALDRDRPQRLLLEGLLQRGIPALDLLPILRAVPPGDHGRRGLYHLRDSHFNARGNRVAGEALAGFLRPFVP